MKTSKITLNRRLLFPVSVIILLFALISTSCTKKQSIAEPVIQPIPARVEKSSPEPTKVEKPDPPPPTIDIQKFIDKVLESDYGPFIEIDYVNGLLRITVFNFAPYYTYLSVNQEKQLEALSDDLFSALKKTQYSPANLTGHANPTGVRNEGYKLIRISQARAAAMATYLAKAGINVGKVEGAGGREVIGNRRTNYGKKLNRRVVVEIAIEK